MIEIQLTKGQTAIIDDEDYELVSKHKWQLTCSGSNNVFYAITTLYGKNGAKKTLRMHRLIMGLTDPKVQCDHENGNGLDNRRGNLRVCTNGQNSCNRGKTKNNTSGFKGVTWSKWNNKWAAQIQVHRRNIHLGYYHTPEAGHSAYCKAAEELHGDFANVG